MRWVGKAVQFMEASKQTETGLGWGTNVPPPTRFSHFNGSLPPVKASLKTKVSAYEPLETICLSNKSELMTRRNTWTSRITQEKELTKKVLRAL